MKAIVLTNYGPAEALRVQEVPMPTPQDNEVLVKVMAASVTFSNLMLITGQPAWARPTVGGFRKPKITIPGSDIAGTVEAVGKNVTQFRPGDAVYGDLSVEGRGGFAEYVCAPEDALGLKPTHLSFEEAAAVPEAALVALQALRDKGHIQKGHKVLVVGASGGIGTFGVQLAKYFGAEVTGVCSTRNLELVRSLGADHVIDYTREDFTRNGVQYDLILATAGYRSIFDYKRALGPNGRLVSTGGGWGQIFQPLLLGGLLSIGSGKKLMSAMVVPNKDLPLMKDLIEAGHIKPVIDRCYPLAEAGEAVRYYGEGHARGKVIIKVAGDHVE